MRGQTHSQHASQSAHKQAYKQARHLRAFAVQPQWGVQHFFSEAAFAQWMQAQFRALVPHLTPKPQLVVLTEFNGLPLLLRGHPWVAILPRFEWAVAALLARYAPQVWAISQHEQVSAIRALQLLYAMRHARLYLQVCRQLAIAYGVYVCCGSLPMPRLYLSQGKVKRRPAVLSNQSLILGPQGELIGATDKIFLTPLEQQGGLDLSAGKAEELRVFPTAVGDLGVAISLDAFRPEVSSKLAAQGCSVLLQPDANASSWTANEGILPPHVSVPRSQPVAWLESAWQVTQQSSIAYAINPMVVGNLFDLSFDGQSAIVGQSAGHDGGTTNLGATGANPQNHVSYVLTEPRQGFLALMPWADVPPTQTPQQVGQQLAAGSGHARENAYRTGVLWADLSLPASEVPSPPETEHEQALRVWLGAG